eukprot:2459860-Ditylum_brightwellii.AAC.1
MLKSLQSTFPKSSIIPIQFPAVTQPYLWSRSVMNLPFWGPTPVYEEVRAAIMRMANSKSPGPTGVTLDAFCAMVWCKADPSQEGLDADAKYLCQYITDVLKLFWGGELDVEAWKTGNLSPVPKP